jgi:MFS family permease
VNVESNLQTIPLDHVEAKPLERPPRLLNRNFALLLQGQFISAIGSQISLIAVVFWIKHEIGSAAVIGMVQMLASMPAVILGPVGGTFADRHSRRTIIVLSDLINGLALFSLAALMFIAPDEQDLILLWISAVFVITGLTAAFFNPAISAAIPDLLTKENIARGNSLSQLSLEVSVFLGQGLGGTIFRLLGAPAVFLIDGITFLFSAVTETFIRIPQKIPERSGRRGEQFREFKRDTLEGFRYLWKKRGLRELVLVSAAMGFFAMPIIILLPFYVEDFLKATPDWYGFLAAAYGVGSVAGYLGAGWLKVSGKSRCRWMLVFILVESAGHGFLGFVKEPFTALSMAFLGGAAGGFVGLHIVTLVQITTPSEIRGRVFGVLATISGGLAPVAMGLGGVAADLLNQDIPLIYLFCGSAMTAISVPLFWNTRVREFLAYEGEPESPSPTPGE